MLSLRFRLLLILLPAFLAASALSISMFFVMHAMLADAWHPEVWIAAVFWFVLLSVLQIFWVTLGDVANSIAHILDAMKCSSASNTYIHAPKFSDSYEIQELLLATKKMLEDLAKSRVLLAKRTRQAEVGKMTAQIVHDIQSPLASMKVVSDTLEEKADKKGPRWLLHSYDLLRLSEQRIRGLIDDLLTQYMERPSAMKIFTAQQLLFDVQIELQSVGGKSIVWENHSPMESIYLRGSMSLLQRGISNIVKNAIEALKMHKKLYQDFQPKITLSAKRNDKQQVEICVQDNGPGIPEDKQKSVLEGETSIGKVDGHGLGMQIARHAAEIHNGTLVLRSKLNQGTQFTFTLPVYEEGKTDGGFILTYSKQYPIVVIDDDPSILRYWEQLGQKNNIMIETYNSWSSLSQAKPFTKEQLIIVDYNLPDMRGGQIIDKLRDQGLENFVLMTADYNVPVVQMQAEKREVRVCPKPLPTIIFQEKKVNPYSILVVDDDPNIMMTWEYARDQLSIEKICHFRNLESIIIQSSTISFETLDFAFVDQYFENSLYSGQDIVAYLKSKGVKTVILASGNVKQEEENQQWNPAPDYILEGKLPQSVQCLASLRMR
jgi:signal transduction histidine kinase/CheY-like chemotaxis protein